MTCTGRSARWSAMLSFVLLSFVQSAFAAPQRDPVAAFFEDRWSDFLSVIGTHSKPGLSDLRPKVVLPSGGKLLDPGKFYLVSLKCESNLNTAKLVSEGLIVEQKTFVAQTLWISQTAGNGAVPSDAAKLVTVFSFEKDKDGTIQDFRNDTCSQSFLLRGNSPVLSVSFSLTDTNKLSLGSTLIFSAAKMLVGIAPALFTGPFGKTITTNATAAGAAQDPLSAVVSAMNKDPRRAIIATNVRASSRPTVITTGAGYSRVEMRVTEVEDITALIIKDNLLQESFYNTFDAISAEVLKDINEATLRDKCAKFANTLRKKYLFNRKDSAFIVGYVAQDAFPSDVDRRLDCIGNKYNATDVVNFAFPYNRDYFGLKKLTLADIDKHFSHTPLSSSIARSYANGLANRLSAYSQTDKDPSKKEELNKSLLSQMANPVHLQDESARIAISDTDISPDQLLSKLNDAGYRRFGCFFLKPTVGAGAFDMIMLALPLNPASGNIYEIDELLGLRLLVDEVNGSNLLKKIQITNDDLAISEAAIENKGKCKGGAKINTDMK